VILHGKTLSNPVHIVRYRWVIFIALVVLVPIYLIVHIISATISSTHNLLSYIIHLIEAILALMVLGGTSYYISKILIWLKNNKTNNTMRKVYLKTKILAALNVVVIAMLILVVALTVLPSAKRTLTEALGEHLIPIHIPHI